MDFLWVFPSSYWSRLRNTHWTGDQLQGPHTHSDTQEAYHEWNPKTAIVFIQHLSYLFKYFQQVSETLNLCFQNSPSILLVDQNQQLLWEATAAAICSPQRWKQRLAVTTDVHGLIPAAVFTWTVWAEVVKRCFKPVTFIWLLHD